MPFTAKELGLDYYAFYDLEPTLAKGSPDLQCQFDSEPEKVEVVFTERVGYPASKNRQPALGEKNNLMWYRIIDPEMEPPRTVVYEDQFGEGKLSIGRLVGLLTPTRLKGNSRPDELDHYKVFEVTYSVPRNGIDISLSCAVEEDFEVQTHQVFYFAVPTAKDHQGRHYEINNEEAHLVIYGVVGPVEWVPTIVRSSDQFGRRTSVRHGMHLLGAPCLKREWDEAW